MARRLLDKRDWDFPSSCWVCEPGNDHGLQVPFYLDEEARQVVAEFTPQPFHSGAPEFAHGGLSMALLDEGMTWALISIARRWGVMRRAQSVFSRPVRLGQRHEVRAWIEGGHGIDLVAAAEILDSRGRVCVAFRADYYLMTREEAARAYGVESEIAREFTRA